MEVCQSLGRDFLGKEAFHPKQRTRLGPRFRPMLHAKQKDLTANMGSCFFPPEGQTSDELHGFWGRKWFAGEGCRWPLCGWMDAAGAWLKFYSWAGVEILFDLREIGSAGRAGLFGVGQPGSGSAE